MINLLSYACVVGVAVTALNLACMMMPAEMLHVFSILSAAL